MFMPIRCKWNWGYWRHVWRRWSIWNPGATRCESMLIPFVLRSHRLISTLVSRCPAPFGAQVDWLELPLQFQNSPKTLCHQWLTKGRIQHQKLFCHQQSSNSVDSWEVLPNWLASNFDLVDTQPFPLQEPFANRFIIITISGPQAICITTRKLPLRPQSSMPIDSDRSSTGIVPAVWSPRPFPEGTSEVLWGGFEGPDWIGGSLSLQVANPWV